MPRLLEVRGANRPGGEGFSDALYMVNASNNAANFKEQHCRRCNGVGYVLSTSGKELREFGAIVSRINGLK
jgi:hypothetical protein